MNIKVDTGTTADHGYETVIGLEVHAQVLTASKMFCSCAASYADTEPNTATCPVCLGLPGALPVMNATAVKKVLATGLALGCSIPSYNKQDRKSYFYPDLPKGYQISQYDLPLCVNGMLTFTSDGKEKSAGITRVHMEEDTGRLLHRTADSGNEESLVDLNRSGVPLMEIVGEPDLRSAQEARDYLGALRQILRYTGASTGSMEEGAFRCDANVSVRRRGAVEYGQKVEIKNLNSFRAVQRALDFETDRQVSALESGLPILQETRGWVEEQGVTVGQRTKEHAHDYRYFPEPDLPPLRVDQPLVDEVTASLPELPAARRDRFVAMYHLSATDAANVSVERGIADAFEAALGHEPAPARAKMAANWIINDLAGLATQRGESPDTLPISGAQLGELLDLIASNAITVRAAKELVVELNVSESPRAAAERLALLALDDQDEIGAAVAEAMAANPEAVQDFRNGKKAAIGRLIGETMKRTGGRASPEVVRLKLEDALNEAVGTGS